MLFDYDNEKKLEEIQDDYHNICLLQNSLSDHRRKYRRFSEEIELDFSVLDECIKRYQNSLLISCYTFSEQITKNVIYELIEKDNNNNIYLNNFLNNKINPDKFSPNVKSTELLKIIRELDNEFNFILSNHKDFNKYDDMVRCRHLYAHANNYSFQFEQFETVIDILEYINFEFTLLTRDPDLRKDISLQYKKLKDLTKSIGKSHTETIHNPKLVECKNVIEDFINKIESTNMTIKILDEVLDCSNQLLIMDFSNELTCSELYSKIRLMNEIL